MDQEPVMLKLINCYIDKANSVCMALKKMDPNEITLLRSKVAGKIPKEGYINGVYYKFHGVGCYFRYADGEINIDFGPNDKWDGFDLWRLRNFLEEMEDKREFITLLNEDEFKRKFKELIDLNLIHNPKLEPSSHLYYLS